MRNSLLTVLAVAASSAVFAAPSARAQEASGRAVSFRVICPEHRDGITSAFLASPQGEDPGEIPLLSGNFTGEYKSRFPDNKVTLVAGGGDATIVAEGKLASAARQVFLLLPDPAGKHPYRILAMNDDERTFPMGGVRILNLCPGPVRFTIAGAEQKPISPGQITIYPPVKTVDEWNMYQVFIDYGTPEGGWVRVSTPSWKGTELKRDFVITTLDPRSRQPRIYNFKDIPPWRRPSAQQE